VVDERLATAARKNRRDRLYATLVRPVVSASATNLMRAPSFGCKAYRLNGFLRREGESCAYGSTDTVLSADKSFYRTAWTHFPAWYKEFTGRDPQRALGGLAEALVRHMATPANDPSGKDYRFTFARLSRYVLGCPCFVSTLTIHRCTTSAIVQRSSS